MVTVTEISPGDFVKVQRGGERLWLKVIHSDESFRVLGVLANHPIDRDAWPQSSADLIDLSDDEILQVERAYNH